MHKNPNRETLQREISNAINRAGEESESDTPDFLLAEYLMGCLDLWNKMTRKRTKYRDLPCSPRLGTYAKPKARLTL